MCLGIKARLPTQPSPLFKDSKLLMVHTMKICAGPHTEQWQQTGLVPHWMQWQCNSDDEDEDDRQRRSDVMTMMTESATVWQDDDDQQHHTVQRDDLLQFTFTSSQTGWVDLSLDHGHNPLKTGLTARTTAQSTRVSLHWVAWGWC